MMRDLMLIVHLIGVALLIGTSVGFMVLAISNAKLEKEEFLKFNLRLLPLGKMGRAGLLLLIISGGYLMSPYWAVLGSVPLMQVKLLLVFLLIFSFSMMAFFSRKASKSDSEKYLKKIEPYGKVSFLLGVTILILAVLIFH